MDTADERIQQARFKRTPEPAIDFVEYIESTSEFFFPDEEWMGASLEKVVVFYMRQLSLVTIIHVQTERSWMYWSGVYWEHKQDDAVNSIMYKILSKISYGGLEQKLVNKNSNLFQPLRETHQLEVWPNVMDLKGLTFRNGTTYYEKEKLQLVPHNPEYMHRTMIMADYQHGGAMSLAAHALLSDITHGSLHRLNILRLLAYKVLNPGFGNSSFYIYGSAGGAKSTLTNFFKEFYPFSLIGTIDDGTLKKTASIKATMAKGKPLVLMNDITTKNLSPLAIEFCKTLIGRDLQLSDQKYKDAIMYISHGMIIMTSNLKPTELNAFNDPGFAQRFITLAVP